MTDETRLEVRLDNALDRARTVRGAAVVIAAVSALITITAGMLMTAVDEDNFPTIGSGLWWAVQTVTTVGYGDNVPTTYPGRLIAAVVMLAGIGFLTVITAAITSSFVARSRVEQRAGIAPGVEPEDLEEIKARLERIEAAVTSGAHPTG